MARVEGFEPARSEQEPIDVNGNPVPVGVWGDSNSGVGVFGTSGALDPGADNIPTNIAGVEGHSIENPGVFGRSIQDAGVFGESIQSTGVIGRSESGSGMLGVTFTPNSNGVFGVSTVGGTGVVGFVGGTATGVIGSSINGTGVQGQSAGGSGTVGLSETGTGVFGTCTAGAGVKGDSISSTGVQGQSGSGDGTGGLSETGTGVFGLSDSGPGVFGFSNSNVGVDGRVNSGTAVNGFSGSGDGMNALSLEGVGVRGDSRGGFFSAGVVGTSSGGFISAGVFATSSAQRGIGVYGRGGPEGWGGLFDGKVEINGTLTKSGGSFKIDHPLEPAHKYLSHSFVESPDMLNVYNGNVTTDAKGEASVTLPDYFEALNQDFCYQLTVIGQFAQAIVAEEIRNNQFTIKTDRPRVKVSWQVTGIRQDPWAVANRIAVEEEKAAEEKGRYLHPELWGQPEEARVHRSPQRENQARRIREDQLRRVSQLAPEQLRQRVEQHLQALLGGDHVERVERQGLMVEARQLSEPPPLEEPPRIDRARLEEEWRQVEELVQRMHQRTPRKEGEGPTSPESH